VLEDLSNPIAMNPPAMMRNGQMHSEYNPDNPDLWTRGPPGNRMHQPVPAPRPPYFDFRGGPPLGFHLPPGVPPLPRELISVPVMDPNHPGDMPSHMKRRFEPEDGASLPEQKRKMPINSRLGPRMNQGRPQNPSQNCSLELRKIPRGLNAISHLNDHFSKFGKITNIQIAYEGDPEAAIVTFSAHAEANVAYRSTEAVLNNRFIKVFWHSGAGTGENQSMNGPTGSLPKPSELSVRRYPSTPSQAAPPTGSSTNAADSTNSAGGPQVPSTAGGPQETPTTSSGAIAPKGSTTYINAASPAAQQAQQRLKTAKLTRAANDMIHKKQKEQHKVAVQLAQGLYHKKQELLQKNIVQMKQLVEKVERTDQLDPARPSLMSTIKGLQNIIDNLKVQLDADSVQIVAKTQPAGPQRKTKEQQQKELLDVELELISKEQHGDDDTYAIKKRYIELQKSLNRGPHFPGAGARPPAARPPVARFVVLNLIWLSKYTRASLMAMEWTFTLWVSPSFSLSAVIFPLRQTLMDGLPEFEERTSTESLR
jgi:RNA-binding protein 26